MRSPSPSFPRPVAGHEPRHTPAKKPHSQPHHDRPCFLLLRSRRRNAPLLRRPACGGLAGAAWSCARVASRPPSRAAPYPGAATTTSRAERPTHPPAPHSTSPRHTEHARTREATEVVHGAREGVFTDCGAWSSAPVLRLGFGSICRRTLLLRGRATPPRQSRSGNCSPHTPRRATWPTQLSSRVRRSGVSRRISRARVPLLPPLPVRPGKRGRGNSAPLHRGPPPHRHHRNNKTSSSSSRRAHRQLQLYLRDTPSRCTTTLVLPLAATALPLLPPPPPPRRRRPPHPPHHHHRDSSSMGRRHSSAGIVTHRRVSAHSSCRVVALLRVRRRPSAFRRTTRPSTCFDSSAHSLRMDRYHRTPARTPRR